MLHIWGDEDRSSCGQRRPALSAAITTARDVVVDLRELRFADCSVMIDLAVLAQRLRADGRRLRLRGPQPQIQRLIEIVRLDRQPAVTLDA